MASWPKLHWDDVPTGPMKGIKVVDMSTIVLGPLATLIFADQGAEVIKIETSEGRGDAMRAAGHSPTGDLGPIFAQLNRNKKSIDLNLKRAADLAIMKELLEGADVFFHNVRMAGMERLGLGYEAVKAISPGIVYVHCAGYGAGGEYGDRQAYDDLIQAASGFAALSEIRDGGRPVYSPSLVADKVSGLFAANATLAALLARANGQGGQFVHVPMFECFTWFNMVENMWGETFIPGNGKLAYSRSVDPMRRPFPTADGYIAIVPYNDAQWMEFFTLGGHPHLFEDPRFSTYAARSENTGALYQVIEQCTAAHTTNEWLDLLSERQIPAMRYNRMEEVLTDPHLAQVGFFEEREGPNMGRYRSMRHPVIFDGTPASPVYAEPPRLGANSNEIKAGLALDE